MARIWNARTARLTASGEAGGRATRAVLAGRAMTAAACAALAEA
jgi:hypothetical protein